MVVGIIGGGASGMAAALAAAENPNIEVLLLERQARVGRKLLATGNGRCNLSNANATVSSINACVPITICISPLAIAGNIRFRSFFLVEPVNSATRIFISFRNSITVA